jgi:hypothetical protein
VFLAQHAAADHESLRQERLRLRVAALHEINLAQVVQRDECGWMFLTQNAPASRTLVMFGSSISANDFEARNNLTAVHAGLDEFESYVAPEGCSCLAW